MDLQAPVYSIGTVSSLTGFSQRQLRYYENIGVLSPSRTNGRHRLYSPADVDRLLALRDLLAEGMTLTGARSVLDGTDKLPSIGERESVPRLDHTALTISLLRGKSLTSIYPVNDQQSLYHLLMQIRSGKTRQ